MRTPKHSCWCVDLLDSIENDGVTRGYRHQDLETNSDSPVTSMMSDHGPSSTFIASFADGLVKVFDRRLEEEDAVVRSYNEHTNWVQNVRWQPQFGNQFVSAR